MAEEGDAVKLHQTRIAWRHAIGNGDNDVDEANVDDVECVGEDEGALAGDRGCAECSVEGHPEECLGAYIGVLGREPLGCEGGEPGKSWATSCWRTLVIDMGVCLTFVGTKWLLMCQ